MLDKIMLKTRSRINRNYYSFLILFIISIYFTENAMAAKGEKKKCHLKVSKVLKEDKNLEENLADVKALLLSDKPDCSVFKVTNWTERRKTSIFDSDWLKSKRTPTDRKKSFLNQLLKSTPTPTPPAEVIKIVRMEIKDGKDRKPMDLLAHEVDMFKLAEKHQSENLIKIYDSHVFSETIYMRMELGEFDMQEMLKRMENKWQKSEYNNIGTMLTDIYEMIDDMATVLADFNRYAIHFALKTENWVYVKVKDENVPERLKLKLIDLQTAATTVGGRVENAAEQSHFFCKQRKGTAFVPSHASPEHMSFCNAIKLEKENQMKEKEDKEEEDKDNVKEEQDKDSSSNSSQHNLPQDLPNQNAPQHDEQPQQEDAPKHPELTAKADIWSMGIVICEILAKTPILSQYGYGYEIVKAVFVPMPSTNGSGENTVMNKEEILKKLNARILKQIFMDQKVIASEELNEQEVKMLEKMLKDLTMTVPRQSSAKFSRHVSRADLVLRRKSMQKTEKILHERKVQIINQMLREHKQRKAKEMAKNKKVKKAGLLLTYHFPMVFELLKEIFNVKPEERPSPKAIKEYVKHLRSCRHNGKEEKYCKFEKNNHAPLDYVPKDLIEKVLRENEHFLKWDISTAEKKFCNFCLFYPNAVKSAEINRDLSVYNEIFAAPRKMSDIITGISRGASVPIVHAVKMPISVGNGP